MASTDETTKETSTGPAGNNVVILCGRVIRTAEMRTLPSGDRVAEFRVSVPRTSPRRRTRSGVVDWFDCAAWTATTRRAVERWEVGDIVELTGSLRTRHYVVAGTGRTALTVEVHSARRVQRADGAESGRAQGSRRTTRDDP